MPQTTGRARARENRRPGRIRYAVVGAAARAGVHVLCEKPMAVTVEECQRMLEAMECAGVHLSSCRLRRRTRLVHCPRCGSRAWCA